MLLDRGESHDTPRARSLLEEAKEGAREIGLLAVADRVNQLLTEGGLADA